MRNFKFTNQIIKRVRANYVMNSEDSSSLSNLQVIQLFLNRTNEDEDGKAFELGLRADILGEMIEQS